MEFDVVVIGGGPAGYNGALHAAKRGLSVALIEKDAVGGTCLNRGCIPTKALLHSANAYSQAVNDFAEIGVICQPVFDESKAYGHKEQIVTTLQNGIKNQLKSAKVTLYSGEGRIIETGKVAVVTENGEEILTAKDVIIATGSSPIMPRIDGIENAINSDSVLSAPVDGEKLVVVGGGVIGMEFASYFALTGKKVVVVEAMDKVLPMFSKEITLQLTQIMKRNGVEFMTGAKVDEIGKGYVVISKNGEQQRVDCDNTIVAIGRKANLKGIGLDSVGIDENARFITVDDNMQALPHLYAVGDVNGRIQLAHYAEASCAVAVDHILGEKPSKDLILCPSCVYTTPEIAVVGNTTDPDAIAKKYLLGGNGKSLVNGNNRGFIKLYAKDDVLIGAEVFGGEATEIIGELATIIALKADVAKAATVIHAHPTVYEAVGEALKLYQE